MAIEPDRRRVLALNDRGLPHLIIFPFTAKLGHSKSRQITSCVTVAARPAWEISIRVGQLFWISLQKVCDAHLKMKGNIWEY